MKSWTLYRSEAEGDLRWATRQNTDGRPEGSAERFLCERIGGDGLLRAAMIRARLGPDEADAFRTAGPDRSALDVVVVADPPRTYVLIAQPRTHSSGLSRLAFVYSSLARSRDAALFCDVSGTILSASRRWRDLYGYESGDVLARNPRLVSSRQHPRSYFRQLWHDLRDRQSDSWSGELVNRRRDGDLVRVWQTITTFRDASGGVAGYLGLTRDMTRQAETLERLSQRLESADRGDQQERRQLAATSRELRSPLLAIVGYLDLAERSLPPEEQHSATPHLNGIRRAARRLDELIAALQTPARPRIGDAAADIARIRLRSLIRTEVALQTSLARHRAVRLDLVEEGLSLPCFGDEKGLAQAMRELVSHAARTTVRGTPVTVRHSTLEDGRQEVAVEIAAPTPPSDAPSDGTEMTAMAPPPRSWAGAPSSASLELAHQVADSHGGTLAEEPLADGGRRLRFRIPLGLEHFHDRIWAVAVFDPVERLWPWLAERLAASQIPAFLVHSPDELAEVCRVELPNLVLGDAAHETPDLAASSGQGGPAPSIVYLTSSGADPAPSVASGEGPATLLAELANLLTSTPARRGVP